MTKMGDFISLFRGNKKGENFFVVPILVIFLILCFSIPSFSALPIFNYVTIILVAILCIIILVWKILFHKILVDYFALLIVVFNIAIFISNIFNKDASHIITYVTLSGMSFCLYQFFLEKKYRNLIHYIIFFAFAAFAVYFIAYYKSYLFNFSFQRIGDKFDNLNTVAYYFLYAFVTSLSLINIRKVLSFLYIFPSLLFIFLLYRTGSRSALILAIICMLIIPFHLLKGKKRFIPFVIDICIIVVGIISVVIIEKVLNISIFSRLAEFFDALKGEGVDYSSANRIELVFQSFQLFLRKPVFGWGNNVFSIYSSERLFAHNNLTELLCNFGLLGFVPFELIVIISFLKIKKTKEFSQTTSFALLLMLCFFGVQFFYVNSQLKFDWIAIAFFVSEATLLSKQENQIVKAEQFHELFI